MQARWTQNPSANPGRYVFNGEVVEVENRFSEGGGWYFGPIPEVPSEEEDEGECTRSYGFKCNSYPGNFSDCEHCPYWKEL